MKRRRTSSVLAICALAVGLVAAACTPPPPPPVENWNFRSTQVQMANSTDEVYLPNPFGDDPCIAIPNCNDEPYVINIWFRAKFGVPGSAQAGVVATDECSPEISVGNGAVVPLGGCSAGNVSFPNVQMLDLADLNDTNKLEVMGVWQWVMEEDQFGIDAGGIAAAFQKVLNDTIASGQAPATDNLVSYLISVLFSGGFVQSFSTAIGLLGINIPLLGDDALGSRLYASLNVRGALSDIIGNSTTPGNISVGFGIPTIQSISIAGLGNSPVNYDGFGSSGADGDHRYWNQWARS
jgi:hypothetical protein